MVEIQKSRKNIFKSRKNIFKSRKNNFEIIIRLRI
jgi:hypothetical protein